MTFDAVLEIYQRHKRRSQDFNFVSTIFAQIRKRYLEDAQQRGKNPNQAWNSWSGHNLERLIAHIISDFIREAGFPVAITSDDQLRHKHIALELDEVRRKLLVFYEQYAIVPDADIILYDARTKDVIAILSCKASLRERVAQAAYWKIKLQSQAFTKNILYYLVSTDNDNDFKLKEGQPQRDRIIVEFGELDGAYIFSDIPESAKIKQFDRIFDDLTTIFKHWFN
jgi:type II restriction enzyme